MQVRRGEIVRLEHVQANYKQAMRKDTLAARQPFDFKKGGVEEGGEKE